VGGVEELIEPQYPKGEDVRPPVGLSIMLRVYFLAAVVQPVGSGGGRGIV